MFYWNPGELEPNANTLSVDFEMKSEDGVEHLFPDPMFVKIH